MTSTNNYSISDIIQLSIDAGHRIMEVYNTDFDVVQKSDNSPVTAADMAAHHTIVNGLNKLRSLFFFSRGEWERKIIFSIKNELGHSKF